MVREVTVVFKEQFLCRPFGVLCSECGMIAACLDQYETEAVVRAHEDFHKHPTRIKLDTEVSLGVESSHGQEKAQCERKDQ